MEKRMSRNFELMNMSKQAPMTSTFEPIALRRLHEADKELRFGDLWASIVRRRKIVFASLAVCLLGVVLVAVFGTRRYRATAEIQVGRETVNNLGLRTEGSQEPAPDAVEDNLTLQTQA